MVRPVHSAAFVALVLSGLVHVASAEPTRCRHRVEVSGGPGVWGFGLIGQDDVDGLGLDLAVHVAPGCGVWLVGGRAGAAREVKIDLFGTGGDEQRRGVYELGPTVGVSLRGDRLGVVAAGGPAITLVRPNTRESEVTLGVQGVLSASVRLAQRIWIGPQLAVNANSIRSSSAFFIRLERVIDR